MAQEDVERKVLLFGFDDLRSILAVKAALDPFGAELVPVAKADYGRTLGVLAGLDTLSRNASAVGTVPGRMAVLCGLDRELDAILPALSNAGAGPGCLKAVLTKHNRKWTAVRLYSELSREQDALRRK